MNPPNGKSHKLKLTPELHRFIQRMGGYFESSGVPPIGGLILGLLMVAHDPMSAEDIASSLKVSRASVSTNFRVLLATGLIEKHTDRADRITYYVFPDTALEQAMLLAIQRAMSFERIVDEGLAALPDKDVSRRRLMQADEYARLVIASYNEMLVEWRARQRRPAAIST
jgi:DNA-binding transcriptional regulator GbsR (MarR family)